jgi:hypothetical protein
LDEFARVHLVDLEAELRRRLERLHHVHRLLQPVARLPPANVVARHVALALRHGHAPTDDGRRLRLALPAREQDRRDVAQLTHREPLLDVVEAREQVIAIEHAQERFDALLREQFLRA